MFNSRYRGFTLFEALLVIAILSSIALYVVTHTRSRAEELLIEQTVGELQNWLTSELAYYSQERRWPTSTSPLITKFYMPAFAECSPWPATGTGKCNQRAVYTIENTTGLEYYATISITLPTAKIAESVARRLPLANVTNNKVTAYAPIPSTVSTLRAREGRTIAAGDSGKKGWIVEGGIIGINGGNSLDMQDVCTFGAIGGATLDLWLVAPSCPSGYEGHYMLFYQQQMTGHAIGEDLFKHRAVLFSETALSRTRDGQPYLKATVNNEKMSQDPHWSYFLTFCLPKGQWFPNGVTGHDEKDGQCTSPWIGLTNSSGCDNRMTGG